MAKNTHLEIVVEEVAPKSAKAPQKAAAKKADAPKAEAPKTDAPKAAESSAQATTDAKPKKAKKGEVA